MAIKYLTLILVICNSNTMFALAPQSEVSKVSLRRPLVMSLPLATSPPTQVATPVTPIIPRTRNTDSITLELAQGGFTSPIMTQESTRADTPSTPVVPSPMQVASPSTPENSSMLSVSRARGILKPITPTSFLKTGKATPTIDKVHNVSFNPFEDRRAFPHVLTPEAEPVSTNPRYFNYKTSYMNIHGILKQIEDYSILEPNKYPEIMLLIDNVMQQLQSLENQYRVTSSQKNRNTEEYRNIYANRTYAINHYVTTGYEMWLDIEIEQKELNAMEISEKYYDLNQVLFLKKMIFVSFSIDALLLSFCVQTDLEHVMDDISFRMHFILENLFPSDGKYTDNYELFINKYSMYVNEISVKISRLVDITVEREQAAVLKSA